jgi:predicted dinucleotide-binding enzyme
MELALSIPGMRAFDGGSLANAIGLEAFAALLLSINIRHRGKASVRLEGVEGYVPGGDA